MFTAFILCWQQLTLFQVNDSITKTQIKNNGQYVTFADVSSANTATNNKDNVQSQTKDSGNGHQTKRFTAFHQGVG